ncbi:hypothetical protein E2C01_018540 [Portunus trituberculatus]|uniref:Uncharacterized protein n=1 Tax=Portunus trituberculatus TaxID=210409 RepID=A0A5B7DWG1_PORTR|nr:hypothetical protein [Portunus trituberculatus]
MSVRLRGRRLAACFVLFGVATFGVYHLIALHTQVDVHDRVYLRLLIQAQDCFRITTPLLLIGCGGKCRWTITVAAHQGLHTINGNCDKWNTTNHLCCLSKCGLKGNKSIRR